MFNHQDRERLIRIEHMLVSVLQNQNLEKETIMATLDDLVAEVTAQKTIIGSVKTLIAGLQQQLADAIASGDPAKVQAVLDQLKANDADLAAAVPANVAPTV